MADKLTPNELERYSRQIMLDGFGEVGQIKLKKSRVIVAGVGGLGCPAATYLACAGVGHITIVDCDCVELSNLNRQILHWDEDIGEGKTSSAAQKLARLNPSIKVTPLSERITQENARDILKGADLVLDALDNFEARFTLNSTCVAEEIPFIHGGIWGLYGEVTTIIPGKTPCFACIYPHPSRASQERKPLPIFGATPGLVAMIQVMEAIKLLVGFGRLLTGRMLYINGATMDFIFRDLVKNPDCKVCGARKEAEQ